jgi:uncharacterized protein YkwD
MSRQRHVKPSLWAAALAIVAAMALVWLVMSGLAQAAPPPSQDNTRPASASADVLTDTYLYLPVARQLQPTAEPEPDWLNYLNGYRLETGLLPLAEVSEWSEGAWLHSRYMVKNGYVGHSEDPNNPWYTPAGLVAGQKGNVFVTSWLAATDETALDFWLAAPFHAIAMLDPQLHSTGFGAFREPAALWQMAATLDVGRGLGPLPPETQYPILLPADGGEAHLWRYRGGEFPDPLSSCPGYSPPTGPPLMIQLGAGSVVPDVSGYSLEVGGVPLASCLYHEATYVNPNSAMQNSGRIILNNRDAIIIMPRSPFTAGQQYNVRVEANGMIIEWAFSTSAVEAADALVPGERAEAR